MFHESLLRDPTISKKALAVMKTMGTRRDGNSTCVYGSNFAWNPGGRDLKINNDKQA